MPVACLTLPACASQFVRLMRMYDDAGTAVRDLNKDEKKGLLAAWYVYLNVKEGPKKSDDLPGLSQLRSLKVRLLRRCPRNRCTSSLLPFARCPFSRSPLTSWAMLLLRQVESLEKTWEEIEVVQPLKDLVSSRSRVFLGTGKSLHLDRILVHDLIKDMNDKDKLDRYAVKSIETCAPPPTAPRHAASRAPPLPRCLHPTAAHSASCRLSAHRYQPAGVLEGGNAFIDLPGQNDVDTGCSAETREGVKDASVIFVILNKSLHEDENSLNMLRESDTIKRAAAGEANVVFLFNREKGDGFCHRQL